MTVAGPALLLTAWAVHDIEEALAFPSTCNALADCTGIDQLRMGKRESWTAVGLMGVVVAAASWRGARSDGRSGSYRAVVAGLEGHVYTHLAASAVHRGYTAGVATAVPVMLPGAVFARRELQRAGIPLRIRDYAVGASLLVPCAIISHVVARLAPPRRRNKKEASPLSATAGTAGTGARNGS